MLTSRSHTLQLAVVEYLLQKLIIQYFLKFKYDVATWSVAASGGHAGWKPTVPHQVTFPHKQPHSGTAENSQPIKRSLNTTLQVV